jgi:hypothetical protein
MHEQYFSRKNHYSFATHKVAVIGAGDVGASLVMELRARPNLGLRPVVFLDDDRKKWRQPNCGVSSGFSWRPRLEFRHEQRLNRFGLAPSRSSL